MKPITDGLGRLLEERKAKDLKKAELEQKLLANKAQRDQAIAGSKGFDDKAALSQLELLLAHKQMAERQLELLGRELEGLKIHVGVEADHVKNKAEKILAEQWDKVLARLGKRLSEFYTEAGQVEKVIAWIISDEMPIPPKLLALKRHMGALSRYFQYGVCPFEVGESILSMVDTAFSECCLADE